MGDYLSHDIHYTHIQSLAMTLTEHKASPTSCCK